MLAVTSAIVDYTFKPVVCFQLSIFYRCGL